MFNNQAISPGLFVGCSVLSWVPMLEGCGTMVDLPKGFYLAYCFRTRSKWRDKFQRRHIPEKPRAMLLDLQISKV